MQKVAETSSATSALKQIVKQNSSLLAWLSKKIVKWSGVNYAVAVVELGDSARMLNCILIMLILNKLIIFAAKKVIVLPNYGVWR